MYTWKQAAARWHALGMHRAPETIRREATLLRWLGPQLDRLGIEEIGRSHLYDVRLAAQALHWNPRTVNYAVQLVGTVLRACFDWEWTKQPAPAIKPLPIAPGRTRWLTPEKFRELMPKLPQPVQDMAIFATFTGLRRSNVCGLLWKHVDVERRQVILPAGVVKTRIPLTVPLVGEAWEVIERRALKRLPGVSLVFHRHGRRVDQPGGHSWYKALRECGIQDFRWHDLRHSWASWHVQSGTTLPVLKEAGGWLTLSMVSRYAHLNTESTRKAAANMAEWHKAG